MNKFFNLIDEKFKLRIFVFIFLTLLQILFESAGIALIPIFLSFILTPEFISKIPFDFIKNIFLSLSQSELIYYSTFILIGLFFIKSLYLIFLVNFQSKLNSEINISIKGSFFNKYLKSPYQFINQYNTSDLLRNIDEETSKFTTNFFLIIAFIKDLTLASIIFIILIYVDFISAITSLIIMVFLTISYLYFWRKKLNHIGEVLISSKKQTIQWVIQSLSMIKEIIITNKINNAANYFLKNVFLYEDSKRRLVFVQGIPGAIFELLIVIFVLLTMLVIINSDISNPIPILTLYAIAAIRLLPIFSRFSNYLVSMRSVLPTIELLQTEFRKLNDINKNSIIIDENETSKIEFNKNIMLKNLSFKYENKDNLILDNISLEINKGSCVAFVGKSGSGKTTLINIIACLLKSTQGEILIDGKSLNNSIVSWQKKIGLLSQDNYLIDDTIKNNIVLLNDDNNFDKKKLEYATLYSGVDEILQNLPDGLNTRVGEKGTFLSSGQIQRIALARLLYRDPEVMIFDEFTNSLDYENEDIILKNLENLKNNKDKTLIIISHKMKPLKISDKIIIISGAKINQILDYNKFYEKFSAVYE
jgi:ABC-type multidrug transport system fused ATPase/permease subunit